MLRVVAAAIVASVIAASVAGCGDEPDGQASSRASCADYRFDRTAWRAGTNENEEGITGRQRISDDLIRCRVLIGRTKGQVREMLGLPPDDEETNARLWTYTTGIERGPIKAEPERFQIRFDSKGRVRSARIADF